MKPNKKNRSKRKKKPSPPSNPNPNLKPDPIHPASGPDNQIDEALALDWLQSAFASLSFDQIASAYASAGRDAFKAASILADPLLLDPAVVAEEEEPQVEIKTEIKAKEKEEQGKRRDEERKKKRVAAVAASGIVANVIGKGYVREGNRGKKESLKGKVVQEVEREYSVEEGEEFLCAMMGEESELGMGVVKDVLGQCGNDVEKALDVLLDISASSFNQYIESGDCNYSCTSSEFSSSDSSENSINSFQFSDKSSDSAYPLSDKEDGMLLSVDYGCRDDSKCNANSEEQRSSRDRVVDTALQQKVLESLFNIRQHTTHEPNTMNWKKVVQQVESFGKGLEYRNGNIAEPSPHLKSCKGNEYEVCRSVAKKHWDTMRTYYQKAAVAYTRGERAHAAQLSETGRIHSSLARKADEQASREIFEARNKDIRNVVTIDLHGQHVKQGMDFLKLHLLLFTYIPSVQYLKVITGSGGNGTGRGKLKRSVISLVKKEGIEWCEENSGTLLLKLDGMKEYKFTEEQDDSEKI